jgi:hypothetical protein
MRAIFLPKVNMLQSLKRNRKYTLRTMPMAMPIVSSDLMTQIEIFGRGVTLFVLFTASLNYLHYKNLREKVEEVQREKLKQSEKKTNKDLP